MTSFVITLLHINRDGRQSTRTVIVKSHSLHAAASNLLYGQYGTIQPGERIVAIAEAGYH